MNIHNSQSQGIIFEWSLQPWRVADTPRCQLSWAQRLVSYFFSVLLIKSTCADGFQLSKILRCSQRIEKKQAAATWRIFSDRKTSWNLKNLESWIEQQFPKLLKKVLFFTEVSSFSHYQLTPSPSVIPIPYQATRPYPRPTWSLCAQLGSKVPREGIISNSLLGGAFHRPLAINESRLLPCLHLGKVV